jgi:tetratricopeptide (TPR) repeat protein/tRNA A-37 threonylcarbamoyl transferase component Bud32
MDAEATIGSLSELDLAPRAGRLVGIGPLGPVYAAQGRARKVLAELADDRALCVQHELARLPAHDGLAPVELVREEGRWVAYTPWAPAEAAPGPSPHAMLQLAEALGALHDAGLVHGHLSAPNVRCDRRGRPWLMDTGLWGPPGDLLRWGPWQELAAPERLRGEPPTPASDAYALGRLLATWDPAGALAGLAEVTSGLCQPEPAARWTVARAADRLRRLAWQAQQPAAQGEPGQGEPGQGEPGQGAAEPQRYGPYQVVRTLGRGGMGIVHLAVHEQDGAPVALKTVLGADLAVREALRRECRCLEALAHPGVARLLAHGVDDAVPWYAMSLVQGESLRRVCARLQRPREGLALFAALADTLGWLHGEGLVHGDLKPDNVLVTGQGRPVIVDFGLASRLHRGGGRETLEHPVRPGGSLPYLAPERLVPGALDPRSDLYALGCMLYEAWCGHPPFVAPTGAELLELHRSRAPRPLQALLPEVPPELDQLVMALLAKEPAERPAYAVDLAASLRRIAGLDEPEPLDPPAWVFRPRFAGRAAELAQLRGWLSGEGPQLTWLAGVSGVGKTRLVAELARHARAQGLEASVVECAPSSPATPARPLAVLRPLLRRLPPGALPPPFRRLLAAYEPSLGEPADPSQLRRSQVLEAVTDALARLHPRPSLLVLGDLHDADELTLAFLQRVAAGALPPRVRVLATWRTEQAPPALSALSARVPGLALGPMPADALAGIVQDMLASEPVPASLAEALAAQSEGNLFYVAESLRDAVASGALRRRGGRWDLGAVEVLRLTLPRSIEELLQARLLRLAPGPRQVARLASVLGREVVPAELAQLAQLPPAEIADALQSLLGAAVLEEGEGELRFTHHQLREVAYQGLPPEQRPWLHRRAAEIVDGSELDPAVVARHWSLAGVPDRAYARYLQAARSRVEASAHADARRLYEAAFAEVGPDEVLGARVEAAGKTTYRLGELQQAIATFEDLLARAQRAADESAAADARAWLVQVYVEAGRLEEAEAHAPLALASFRALGDEGRTATMLETASDLLVRRGRLQEAIAHHEEAIAIFTRLGWTMQLAPAYSRLGGTLRYLGDFRASLAWEERALVLVRAAHDRFFEGIVLSNIGSLHVELGDLEAAEAHLLQATALHRQLHNRRSLWICLLNRAELALQRPSPAEARALLDEALALHATHESAELAAYTWWMLGNLARVEGRRQEAWAALDQAVALQRQAGIWPDLALTLRTAARVARELDADLARAGELAAEALQLEETSGSPSGEAHCLCELGLIALASGQDGAQWLGRARGRAGEGVALQGDLAELEREVARVAGLTARR